MLNFGLGFRRPTAGSSNLNAQKNALDKAAAKAQANVERVAAVAKAEEDR